jgi:hypothetical protein
MDDLSATPPTTSLGERIETFKPTKRNVIAGAVLCLLFVGCGLAIVGLVIRQAILAGGKLPAFAQRDMSWFVVVVGSLIGLGLAAAGVPVFYFLRRLRVHRVDWCENGFRYWEGERFDEVVWETVESVRETLLYERPPIFYWPLILLVPVMVSRSYVVRTKKGDEFCFDCNSINGIIRFGELLRERAERARIDWEIVEERG